MFCRNCGKEQSDTPEYCLNCGAKPLAGNKFCQQCGNPTDPMAEICVKCGAKLAKAEETSTGIQPNVAGLLCYLVGWITGLIFFLIEREDKFVRFHAMQSIVTFGGINAISIALFILRLTPYIRILFDALLILVLILAVVIWILLMVKAYQGEKYMLPVAGDLAEKYT